MGSTVFGICLGILVALLAISGFLRSHNRRMARKQYLYDLFTDPDKNALSAGSSHDPALALYLHNKHPDRFVIDPVTANDLQIDDVFADVNRCVSFPGMDMLYSTLYTDTKEESEDTVYEEAKRLLADKAGSVALLEKLDKIPRFSGTDEFLILKKLSETKAGGAGIDIAVIILLVLSVALTAVYPLAGFIFLLVMICAGIATYFSGRARMLENLKGVSLALRLIVCSHDLYMLGRDEFKGYERLRPLCFANRLISYRDGTSSDPLSLLLDYVRMITHIDLIIYKGKIAAIRKETDTILALYRDIGRLDMCLALASYLSSGKCCSANVTDERIISSEGLYHPLIGRPVCNDITSSGCVLLTGSNASGKSTFLKAVGLNVIFARNFGFAFASSFTSGAFDVYTSMAVRDDIKGGESYYVVEARSIKRLADAYDRLSLCIIDEVFRGTNTVERIAASTALLEFLGKGKCLCFAATHDRELCTLLKDSYEMYHFTEEINEDNVTFPFLLKKGVSDTTNAIRLLDMLGFDEAITDKANKLVDHYKNTGNWT